MEAILRDVLTKIMVSYISVRNPRSNLAIIERFPSTKVTYSTDPNRWDTQYSRDISTQVILGITSQKQGLDLLTLTGEILPELRACPSSQLDLSLLEYAYLWSSDYCKVLMPGSTVVNYSAISRFKELQVHDLQSAVDQITLGFSIAQPKINSDTMTTACSSTFSFDDMKIQPYAELCGCYISIPWDSKQFTSDEKQIFQQHPQCLPSCLDARIRYIQGGNPVTCQQNLCIIDDVDITGTTTSISQVCNQCTKKYSCVCYIHVNGRTLDNSNCNTVYTVGPDGTITNTTVNGPGNPGTVWKSIWNALIHSRVALITLLVVIGVLIISLFLVLFRQEFRSRKFSVGGTH